MFIISINMFSIVFLWVLNYQTIDIHKLCYLHNCIAYVPEIHKHATKE